MSVASFDLLSRYFKTCLFDCSYSVHIVCFIQMEDFIDLDFTVKPRAKIPGRRDFIGILEKTGKCLAVDIVNML